MNEELHKDNTAGEDKAVKEEQAVEQTAEKAEKTKGAEETEKRETNEEKEEPSREEQLEAQVAQLNDRLLRNLAEFDNFRKRSLQEKAAMYSAGAADAAEKLLPVLDNFERAVFSEQDKTGSFYKGVEMILKQMLEAFAAIGIKEIEAEGKPFDPNFHNAVMHTEDDSLGENTVSQVLQKGYIYNDKVIRPAMVAVAN